MYNKNESINVRAEKLFGILGEVGDGYLQEAIMTDDAEKLLSLKKEDKKKKRYERSELGLWYKAAACFACFATVVGIVIGSYIADNAIPEPVPWEGFEAIEGEIEIDGIDSLNYYSARRAIGLGTNTAVGKVSDRTAPIDYPLDDGDKENGKDGAIFYEFDPAWDFTVTKVVYFRAELKEKNGFLAARLGGVGEMDVIITENSIEDMITFKRGGRYFSCHVNGYYSEGKTERLEFTTHKYTEGFYIVKNFSQDNYSFNVVIDKGRVVELDCDYLECTDGVWNHEADRIGIVEESSITMKTNVTFNITGLEAFFNSIVSQSYMTDDSAVTKKHRIA